MHRDPLLPGVTFSAVPPVATFDPRIAIAKARRRAIARDVVQVLLVIAVDALFVRWPYAHVPVVGRDGSVTLLILLNLAVAAHLWLARWVPRWTARRIASTWCHAERRRFFDRQV
jgi:hypothetical protein